MQEENTTMTIQIKLKDKNIEVKQHPEDSTLYCLNDLHKASGGKDKHRVNYFTEYSKSRKSGIKILSLKGRYGGSYTDEKTVYKYAAWIDDSFYDVVFEAFKSAANGDSSEASRIANTVAIPQALIDSTKDTERRLQALILRLELQGKIKLRGNGVSTYLNLACEIATGYRCKALTSGYQSAIDYIVSQGNQSALSALKVTMERIGQELALGNDGKGNSIDYQLIAAKLGKKTSRNGYAFARLQF
ncbi:KilA-N domain-containing protein [Endozoicomonas sp. ONNA1]|uniref:KilA-N domain-containing protein n=1 Tax=Endozoicomonas sp. ONNA1 TaxID=2828740 RepID=UPI0021472086|nr:KilA-N domain-containing protein [Endozoicomonas sp. ONNA1]